MENNSYYFSSNDSNKVCGTNMNTLIKSGSIKVYNKTNTEVKILLSYSPVDEERRIEENPMIIYAQQENTIIIPYNATYIFVSFQIKNYNDEWSTLDEKTYFDPQERTFKVIEKEKNFIMEEI